MDNSTKEHDEDKAGTHETTAGVKRSAPESTDEPAHKRGMHAALPPNRSLPMMPSDFSSPTTETSKEQAPASSANNDGGSDPAANDNDNNTAITPTTAAAKPVVPPSSGENADPAQATAPSSTSPKPASSNPLSPTLQPRTNIRGNTTTKKAASNDKSSNKGLRHFSMEVCKKVEEKGTTTYNEVADELVQKVLNERKANDDSSGKFDEKNIRRRVYDALNVLMAMDIIAKEKKQISWKGLPSSAHHDLQMLEREEQYRKEQVESKRKALQEVLLQQICFRNLVSHNKEREAETVHAEKVPLPFIVVNSHKEAVINCNMAPDLNDVLFEFDRPFEINDDNSILTRLGMHKTSIPTLREMVPDDLVNYCQEHGLLDSVLGGGDESALPPNFSNSGSHNSRAQYFKSLE